MKRPAKVAVCAACLGALVTVCLFALARQLLQDSFGRKLSLDVSTRARIVREKLEAAVLVARGAAGFAETLGVPGWPSFGTFAAKFIGEDTGLRALALVAAVPGGERARFEATVRALPGMVDFTLYEGLPGVARQPLQERGIHYPVFFTKSREPGATAVLGYDLGSSPVRLSALERSRDTGEATVTERISLVGTAGKPGFIVFFPIYGGAGEPATPAQRREALTGFVQAIFSLEDLTMAALKSTTPAGLPFELQDWSAAPEGRSIFRWTARLQGRGGWRSALIPPGIHLSQRFPFAGREWAIDVAPNAAYLENAYPLAHWLVLPIGLLLTWSLAAYLHAVLSRREELAQLNAALEAEIARRGRSEDALRASEEQYRVVADNTYEWEFLLDPAERFVYSSPASERITGHGSAEFLADPELLERIILPEDLEICRRHRRDVAAAPALSSLAFRIRHRDGSVRWIDHVCQPVFDRSGRFAGTRGSHRDVTEKRRIEEERERLIAELRQAQKSIRTLEGILPICASCKKIRNEKDDWVQIESYVSQHSRAAFTHGICPECVRELYPGLSQKPDRGA